MIGGVLSPSLRGRLLGGFVLVILVTLVSAGSAVLWLVQDYQRRLAVDRLSEVAMAASLIGRQLEARDARPDEIGAILASQLMPASIDQVRVLVLDVNERVLAESPLAGMALDASFVGRLVDVPALADEPARGDRRSAFRTRAIVWTGAHEGVGRSYIFVTSPQAGAALVPAPGSDRRARIDPRGDPAGTGSGVPRPELRDDTIDRFLLRPAAYRIVLAVPEGNIASAWRELAPSLGRASLIGVAAAVVVAFWLSRSITHPLRQITLAAQRIARGDLRQSIPVRGRDEVGQLAMAFNSMSQEVEQSHRALREFLANASHELRTPLTSIQGFSQALVEGAVSGQAGAMEAGQIIHEEANRMRRLVEDLLYLSRVEAQDVPARREPVDVATLIRDATRRLQLVADQRDLALKIELPTLPLVLGDPDELDRLFSNLLDNAGKYTPDGGQIIVRGTRSRQHLRVAFHNTGSVITPDDLPHVFERFYRVDKSRARGVEGSGLGLAIAKEVVERHGGTISVTSDPQSGTTFSVTLKAAAEQLLPAQTSEKQALSPAGVFPPRPRIA
jgi:signal transduction histidine kinase